MKVNEQLAAISWEGDSKEVLSGFPDAVRRDLGYALWELQRGEKPTARARRMESLGAGVFELRERDEHSWYRVIYLSRINDVIYVLHCFEERSRRTDQRDLDTARQRLSWVKQRIREQRAHEKRRE
jgi:phage-related protein